MIAELAHSQESQHAMDDYGTIREVPLLAVFVHWVRRTVKWLPRRAVSIG